MYLMLQYKLNNNSTKKYMKHLKKAGYHGGINLVKELLEYKLIQEVIVFNIETERLEWCNADKILSLIKDGMIVNLQDDGSGRRAHKFKVGNRYARVTRVYENEGDNWLDYSPNNYLMGLVGASTDGQYIIAVTLRGELRFIGVQDIIDRRVDPNCYVFTDCFLGKDEEAIDISDKVLRRDPTKGEELRLKELSNRNDVLNITGNEGIYWSSYGSLHINKEVRQLDIREANFIGLTLRNKIETYDDVCKLFGARMMQKMASGLSYDGDQPKLLETVNIQSGKLYISSKVFWNTFKLETLSLPDELEYIGEDNFVRTNLKDIDLSNCKNVAEIGRGSFSLNQYLEKLILPTGCKKIHYDSYSDNTRLKELTFPKNLEYVNCVSILSNQKLEKIVLPEIRFKGLKDILKCARRSADCIYDLPNIKMIVTTKRNTDIAKVLANGRDIIRVID